MTNGAPAAVAPARRIHSTAASRGRTAVHDTDDHSSLDSRGTLRLSCLALCITISMLNALTACDQLVDIVNLDMTYVSAIKHATDQNPSH
jgi:hypothetical protein